MPRAVPTRRPTRRSPGWPRCTRTWASAAPWWCRPCHGADHAALLDALARSEGRYRGVALLGADATPASVRALHDAGVRGARFNFVPHLGGAPDPAVFDHVVGLIAPLGWHLCLHLDGAQLPAAAALRALPLPFVIDHMGRVRAPTGWTHRPFARCWAWRTCRAPG